MPVIYDLETFPNVFLCGAIGADTDDTAIWEISERRDDRASIAAWLHYLAANKIEMVGYNNVGFDYPILHLFLSNPGAMTPAILYEKCRAIINDGSRFGHVIWESDRWIPQIDLYKIHHFDNPAKATGLKALEVNMRCESVEDLPFEPGAWLTFDQIDALRSYLVNDLTSTKRFYDHTRGHIEFRRYLSDKYGRDFMNHNDTKIGKDYFVMRLEEAAPGSCYTGQPRRPVQTIREKIALNDIILPVIRFDHPEFTRVLTWLRSQVIHTTKGVFTDVSCEVDGFTFTFGTGGIHGSVTRQHVRADADHALIDLDVASFYPNIAIVNRLHPAHLGELFCDIYKDVFDQRRTYKKGSPENNMLKLALNGVYGDSNNMYSPFYDPQYTMSITVNGQLLLCMLAERLMMTVPGLRMIQINTDGLTVSVPRRLEWLIKDACDWWQRVTGLTLEDARYSSMFIRDVNNYLAVSESGKIKRKGAYDSRLAGTRVDVSGGTGWHMDTSALIVPRAAEHAITTGGDPAAFIRSHRDPFDFMLRAKVPRGSTLMHGDSPVQGTTRYYIANHGAPLVKVSPPKAGYVPGWFKKAASVPESEYRAWHAAWGNTWNPAVHTKNRSTHEDRSMQIQAGWLTAICNRADAFDWENLNYEWYIAECRKLLDT